MSANKKPEGPFEFGIMELSRFLNRSPSTLRKYEADGLFTFPRNNNGERTFHSKDIRQVVAEATNLGRIDSKRQHLIEALMTLIEMIEEQNTKC